MAKNKREIKKERNTPKKNLYIEIEYTESRGTENSNGNGKPYSGYSHSVINITSIGSVFYSEKGSGRYFRYIEEWKKDVDWENLGEKELHLVLIVYNDGGTFGRTDGYFNPAYLTDNYEDAQEWVRKNKEKIERRYNGYFSELREIKHKVVKMAGYEVSADKNWWE